MANDDPSLFAAFEQTELSAAVANSDKKSLYASDLRGQKFGLLTVLADTGERKHTYVVWLCRCECGRTTKANTQGLKSGHRTTCRDKSHKNTGQFQALDLTGMKFGKLTALERTEYRCQNSFIWRCRCDCGKETFKPAQRLMQTLKKGIYSCGCLPRGRRPKMINSGFRQELVTYQRAARDRRLCWELSAIQTWKLFKGDCYYCGAEPMRKIKVLRRVQFRDVVYVCNGIDRIDSGKGYTTENCVSCCTTCNRAKSSMKVEDFKAWIVRVYAKFVKGESQ